MKRILPMLLLLLILALLSGCTDSSQKPLPTPEPTAIATPTPEASATPESVSAATPTTEASPDPSSEPVAAQAPEAVPTTISLEGTQETIQVVSFESKHGYSIQYDVNAFAPESSQDQAQDVFWPTNADAMKGVSLTIQVHKQSDYTLLNAEADLQQALLMDRYSIEKANVPEKFSSYEAVALRATKDNLIVNAYLIAAEGNVFTLKLSYPSEAAEGFGARLLAMAETFVPAKAK
ncbi:MAG TPA: hypothetical protein PKE04_06470 [Clostridia bacterium]|nr:hypothetical protein [Clostridia bacterium]